MLFLPYHDIKMASHDHESFYDSCMEINLSLREKSTGDSYAIADNAAVWKPALTITNI